MSNKLSREEFHRRALENYKRRNSDAGSHGVSHGTGAETDGRDAESGLYRNRSRQPQESSLPKHRPHRQMTEEERYRRYVRKRRKQQEIRRNRIIAGAAVLLLLVFSVRVFGSSVLGRKNTVPAETSAAAENSAQSREANVSAEGNAGPGVVTAVSQNPAAGTTAAESTAETESSLQQAQAASNLDFSDPTHILSNGRYLDATKPMIALTFDDGTKPEIEARLINILNQVDGRATFFLIGQNIVKHPEGLQALVNAGMEIGNHSFDHDLKLSKKGCSYIESEFSRTDEAIKKVSGFTPVLVRLPGGIISKDVSATLRQPIMYWSIDTKDWKTRDAASTRDAVLNHAQDGDIVLMHSLYASTATACEVIIPELSRRGFQLVTVSELIALRHADVSGGNGIQYHSFRPTADSRAWLQGLLEKKAAADAGKAATPESSAAPGTGGTVRGTSGNDASAPQAAGPTVSSTAVKNGIDAASTAQT